MDGRRRWKRQRASLWPRGVDRGAGSDRAAGADAGGGVRRGPRRRFDGAEGGRRVRGQAGSGGSFRRAGRSRRDGPGPSDRPPVRQPVPPAQHDGGAARPRHLPRRHLGLAGIHRRRRAGRRHRRRHRQGPRRPRRQLQRRPGDGGRKPSQPHRRPRDVRVGDHRGRAQWCRRGRHRLRRPDHHDGGDHQSLADHDQSVAGQRQELRRHQQFLGLDHPLVRRWISSRSLTTVCS